MKIDLERASAVTKYDVYVGIDGGEKQLLSSLNVAPKSVAKSRCEHSPMLKMVKREVEIEVREGERIVYHDKENILVTNGYTKQFMDEFTRVGINYQWTNGHTVDTGNNDDLERLEFAGFNAERSDRLWSYLKRHLGRRILTATRTIQPLLIV